MRDLPKIKIEDIKIVKEWRDLMPAISGEEEKALINDIRENGVCTPIELLPDFTLVDGHQRYRIVRQNFDHISKLQYIIRTDIPLERIPMHIIRSNLHRRHLSKMRQVQLVVEQADKWGWFEEAEERMKEGKKADPRDKMSPGFGKTRTRIAKTFGVPEYMVKLYLRLKAEKEMDTLVNLLDGGMKPKAAQKKLDDKVKRKENPPKKPSKDIMFIPLDDKGMFDMHIDRLKVIGWTPSQGDTLKLVLECVTLKKENKEKKEKKWKSRPFKDQACVHGVVGGCVQCYRDADSSRGKKSATIKQDAVKIPVGKEEMSSFRVLPDREAESCYKCEFLDQLNTTCIIDLSKDKIPEQCRKFRK